MLGQSLNIISVKEREREKQHGGRTRVPGQRVAPSSSTLAKERERVRERERGSEGGRDDHMPGSSSETTGSQ